MVADRGLWVVYRASDDSEQENWVVVRFRNILHIRFGHPNDEVLPAHPLAKHGLTYYDVFEVVRSPLIEEIKKQNSIHPRHSDAMFSKDRHWVFTFQDETLEVISTDTPMFEVVSASSARDALRQQQIGNG